MDNNNDILEYNGKQYKLIRKFIKNKKHDGTEYTITYITLELIK